MTATLVEVPFGTELILATHNEHKVEELAAILAACGVHAQVVSARNVRVDGKSAPEIIESGVTFAENSIAKAAALAELTGYPCVADDSGLAVDVLGGAPGIFSARWSGRHGDDDANLRLLLAQLGDIHDPYRGAAFVCAAALVTPDGRQWCEEGRLVGDLATQPRGSGGFGYDPILVPRGDTRTCAELSPEEKNAISHRGQALRALAPAIEGVLGDVTR